MVYKAVAALALSMAVASAMVPPAYSETTPQNQPGPSTQPAPEKPPEPPAGEPGNNQPPAPATPTGQPTPPEPPANPEDDKVVCKKVEKATGSRIGSKNVCMTVREWRDYKEED